MAVLNATQRTNINSLIKYLAFNHDLPMPAEVIEQLDKIFGHTSGFPCACGVRGNDLRNSFKDEPIRTFLRLILELDTAATGGTLAATPAGVTHP